MAWNWGWSWFGGLFGKGSSGPDLLFAGLFRGGRANGRDGDDVLIGGFGNDRLKGGGDDDRLFGGWGNDKLIGGSGDDHLKGGRGYDKFVFDPSNEDEGDDVIKDFDPSKDKISLEAADIFRASPNVIRGGADETALGLDDLDPSSDWQLTESEDGFVVVEHPGGTIELKGIAYDESLTFADLAGALEVKGLVSGDDGNDSLSGGRKDDLVQGLGGNDDLYGRRGDDVLLGGGGNDDLFGGKGDDDLFGGSGNDHLTGGKGADEFRFDPSNDAEGDDIIKDFELGTDKVVLNAADVFRADTDILSAGGDTQALDLTDFDDADDSKWDVVPTPDADQFVLVVHPGGTIEVEGIPEAAAPNFAALVGAGALGLEGFVDGDQGGVANDDLSGTNIDDLVQGREGDDSLAGENGDDVLIGGSGDDHLTGGADGDKFFFNPANDFEGADVIKDFTLGEDAIVLRAVDILAADPGVEGGDGVLQPSDLDADDDWELFNIGNDLAVRHPGGTIELDGVELDASGLSFQALVDLGAVEIA